MIEVEQHFFPSATYNFAALASRLGVVPSTKVNTDVYYDTLAGSLAMRDLWLRIRNGAPELKVRRRNPDGTHTSKELESPAEIAEAISMGLTSNLDETLALLEIVPAYTIRTQRAAYKLSEGFTVCVDHVATTASSPQQIAANHGCATLQHVVIEAERMVETPDQVPAALSQVLEWGASQGLTAIPLQNKGLLAIKAFNPALYAQLPYIKDSLAAPGL